MFENTLSRLRLLPILVLVACACFAIRFGEVVFSVSSGAAMAASEEKAAPPPQSTLSATDEQGDDAQAAPAEAPAKPEIETPKITLGNSPAWVDSTDTDLEYSEVRAELFETLAARRKALDAREAELDKREALLKAAQQEIDMKVNEMNKVKGDIQGLLKEQSAEEAARITSLVKVYEGMKAKDAANIFNTLDMDILIEVMGRMSERKLAPILAEMDPERARSVTIFLAEQKRLPSMPGMDLPQ
ncbi:MAG: MotE family protein [Pseudobdellovibrionaceae bacterium]